jgi:hypothetical protein
MKSNTNKNKSILKKLGKSYVYFKAFALASDLPIKLIICLALLSDSFAIKLV